MKLLMKKNKNIIEYNDEIDRLVNQINKLEKQEDFIEFERINYGIPYIYNSIHRENNCFGLIIEDYYRDCGCNRCESWSGCGSRGTQYYKCEKCDYKCF